MKWDGLGRASGLTIVGADCLSGQEILSTLETSKTSIRRIRRFASTDSWEELTAGDGELAGFEPLRNGVFEAEDAVIFAGPPALARKYVPLALAAGSVVVDVTGAFASDAAIPLVVPQVNADEIRQMKASLVASPGVGAIALALALKPIQDAFGLERVVVTTLHSVSEAGRAGFDELSRQTTGLLNAEEIEAEVFPHPVAFNCVPVVGPAETGKSCGAEERISRELQRLLELSGPRVVVSAVQVPTFAGFGATVAVQTTRPFGALEVVREKLDDAPGVHVLDRPESNIYPTSREAAGGDSVFVGRLRRDETVPTGLVFWLSTDDLRRGAALNALDCLEAIFRFRSLH